MPIRLRYLPLLFASLPAVAQDPPILHGSVWLLGAHNAQQRDPAVGAKVSLQGVGNSVQSAAGGEFRLSLPTDFRPGEDITLIVEYPGYQIFQPAGGHTKLPSNFARQIENIELLPVGSKRFLADAQIEALIQAAASAPKPPPQANHAPPDFNAYIENWAKAHGLDETATLAEIDRWAKQVQAHSDDWAKLGLAAFAEKNFRKAEQIYTQAAEDKAKQLATRQREVETLTADTVAYYRKAGDAAYYDNRFRDALAHYQEALAHAPKDRQTRLWAAVSNDMAKAQWVIGIRAEGAEAQRLLAEAAATFKQLLTVHTRADNPKDWAMTQNNLAIVLRNQGVRIGGEAGAKLLGEAVAAYREALRVFTRQDLPQDWAMTQNNLGNALQEQGIRTGGEAGAKLLGEAVTAYREALRVYTRQDLPQQWATTQNNLGNALAQQGIRASGEAGAKLLGEAVAAYREALLVYTRQDLPQDWAMTQNNLGAALRNQGTRTSGEAGAKLLGEAVAAYREALRVYTRQDLPQQWAMTQNNLGNALAEQGIRISGEAGAKLLGEAIAAYREALLVFTRQDLPQQWAATQNNLGSALKDQGIRTSGEAGAKLLGEAVAAYREALLVRTRQDLPQDWATTQNNLGVALQEQGIRASGKAGAKLLGEAVTAYRLALEIHTRDGLPADWQQTTRNLAATYMHSKQWQAAADLFRELYRFDPNDAGAYRVAAIVYHDTLFDYRQAYALDQDWLKCHPDDLDAAVEFAEKHLTTARFADAARRFAALLAQPGLPAATQAALRGLDLAAAAALGQPLDGKRRALREQVAGQGEGFKLGWTFTGTRHFIATEPRLAPKREWLGRLLDALESKDRQSMLRGLDTL